MVKNLNPKEYVHKKEKEFTREMVNDTLNYQQKYGFEIGENNIAHNNESDAFRHAYMQAMLSTRYHNIIAKWAGDIHEDKGNKKGQDPRESNMDLWNNNEGRQIADEIYREYPNFKSFPETTKKDIIAQKVVERIKAGKLITNLEDTRKYNETKQNLPYIPMRSIGGIKNGQPTGQAANIREFTPPYTRGDIKSMTPDEFSHYEKSIMSEMQKGKILNDTRTKSEINRQKHSTGSSASNDGKWVTINGNHVLIK